MGYFLGRSSGALAAFMAGLETLRHHRRLGRVCLSDLGTGLLAALPCPEQSALPALRALQLAVRYRPSRARPLLILQGIGAVLSPVAYRSLPA